METKEVKSYRIDLHLAGDCDVIRQACREFCYAEGLCVTIQAQAFVYTGGEEAGARVGLVNYPRFPSTNEGLWAKASVLGHLLLERACQHSLLMESPDRTVWLSRRDECTAAK